MSKQKIVDKPNGQALLLRNVISRLKRRQEKLSNEIDVKVDELQNICIHDDYKKEESYVAGGYLDREEYHTTYICNVCGKVIDRDVKYGGFG